jgi:uncharacterized protein (DUF1501 family)
MSGRTLVTVFLRGGADGLYLVPPIGDDDYHRARPTLAVKPADAIRLDPMFALHPLLKPLARWFHDGRLAVVHACGCDDDTRSHFEAQDLVEHAGRTVAGGWIGRFLRATASAGGGALDAVALGTAIPESLRSAPSAAALESFAELGGAEDRRLHAALAGLYAGDPLLAAPAHDALTASERLADLAAATYRPEHGAVYAADGFSERLARAAQLIKAGIGARAITIDLDGWDSHFVQDTVLAGKLTALAAGLDAFATDLGARLAEVSVVVMTEFGRRVAENASLGTDHGRGGALFVLGGGTPGGMHCRWPGLQTGVLEGPGDVPVVHDWRSVVVPVLKRHGAMDLERVLPEWTGESLPV